MNSLYPQRPYLTSWNVTRRCHLKCAHCYLDSAELDGANDMPTAEALGIIDELSELSPGGMLIMTGGEPLLRPDLEKLIRRATRRGLTVVLGTSGSLFDAKRATALKECGLKGVGISVDSTSESLHDRLRGVTGAWQEALAGIWAAKEAKIDFQLHFTATTLNQGELDEVIAFGNELGARAVNVFFLVCTGRGQDSTDLSPNEYEIALKKVVEAEKRYRGKMMVRARCAPHVLRVAEELKASGSPLGIETSGCIAARGYMRISPEGRVTPCPYIPEEGQASLKESSLSDLWHNDERFVSLRSPRLKGKCSGCDFEAECGGCRARALATGGDMLGEDPLCAYKGRGASDNRQARLKESAEDGPACAIEWSQEAIERLGRVPFFLRKIIKKSVESYAIEVGADCVTTEHMAKLREKVKR